MQKVEAINKNLSIAQKIRLLRKSKDMNQDGLAAVIISNQGRVSRIEVGNEEYSEYELQTIKKRFDIVDMPLTELECAAFKERLYIWRDLIRDLRIKEAKEMQERLSPITNLDPCDFDLPTLYRLFEVLLLLTNNELDAAEEKMQYLDGILGEMKSDEHIFHYYHRKGSFLTMHGDFENALDFCLKAYDLKEFARAICEEDVERLCGSIAICYTRLEMPNKAIKFINEVHKKDSKKRTALPNLSLDISLAVNYIKIGEYKDARKILDKCLLQSKAMENDLFVGIALFNLGILHRHIEKWDVAVDFFDQAMKYFVTNTSHHIFAFYYKVCCLIEERKFVEAEHTIRGSRRAYDKDSQDYVLFEALYHILIITKGISIFNKPSVDFVDGKLIPYLKKSYLNFEAIKCYKLLERNYKRSGKEKMSSLIGKDIYEAYERMFTNQKGGEDL